ncbi:unnamed protein product (macronuclear) [Paramecium tetraurelia]|uniref:Cell division protein ZapB n=1 Tax=Paramecium tetraurelia TaxID=5888 RepID=A0DCV2_PARTE|nr:uncharacterized protein GSPATT00015728001 [Paramecium tetraurelia]CAK80869.1 unnamed protein product [Paramecium tetraurelia]|eukprot:XP_001448266.1 hypothetical protein (macronuclear) [Paramecium tetraurelia strain d4-2]
MKQVIYEIEEIKIVADQQLEILKSQHQIAYLLSELDGILESLKQENEYLKQQIKRFQEKQENEITKYQVRQGLISGRFEEVERQNELFKEIGSILKV